jgi:hypothetical protein
VAADDVAYLTHHWRQRGHAALAPVIWNPAERRSPL